MISGCSDRSPLIVMHEYATLMCGVVYCDVWRDHDVVHVWCFNLPVLGHGTCPSKKKTHVLLYFDAVYSPYHAVDIDQQYQDFVQGAYDVVCSTYDAVYLS